MTKKWWEHQRYVHLLCFVLIRQEINLILPACDYYKVIGGQCADAQISIDLFFLSAATGVGTNSTPMPSNPQHSGHDASHHSAGNLSWYVTLAGSYFILWW